jgi:glutaconate CoA-transferase, subunit A
VEPAVIRSDPNRTLLPGFLVTAVVHLPGGAHPSPVQGHYNRDHAVYADWHARSATVEGAVGWLDEWVRGPGDHAGYLAKLGRDRLDRLRPHAVQLAAPVDYGC